MLLFCTWVDDRSIEPIRSILQTTGFGLGNNVHRHWIAGLNLTAPTARLSYQPFPMQNQMTSRAKYPRLKHKVQELRRLCTILSHGQLIQLNRRSQQHCHQCLGNPLHFTFVPALFPLLSNFTPTAPHSPLLAARELMIRLTRPPRSLSACG